MIRKTINSGGYIEFNPNEPNDVVLPTSNVYDHLVSKFKLKMIDQLKSIFHTKVMIACSRADIIDFFDQIDNCIYYHQITKDRDVFYFDERELLISCTMDDAMVTVNIIGNRPECRWLEEMLNSKFQPPGAYVRWIYDPQYMESMEVAIPAKNQPFSEMYPFLGSESLESYYDRFIESDASILLLLGPPGTGKTSFLRGLLHHTKENAILTYHHKLLEQDDFFAQWFKSNDENIVIMEDSDTLLLPRTDGNSMMQRFLNLGDGLLSINGKKMIFTTNLPNTNSIDEALTRPGRCHDILEFRPLTRKEAQVIADKSNVSLSPDKDDFTIAEIFSDLKTRKTVKKQSFGFI